jgi:UDP-arabinose 4-epimerase
LLQGSSTSPVARAGHDHRGVVLVTGGAGFVGSHACQTLARAGYEPVTFDDLRTGDATSARYGPLVVGDLASPADIGAALAAHRPTAVLHFAASAYVGESVTDPAKYYRNNVANTLNLLEAMRANGVDLLVFSSTCATYGEPRRLPIDESHPQRPINPYGHAKLFVEGMLASFDVAYGLRSVALRYFNAAGADPDGEIGENHEPETHLIPLVIQTALGHRPALEIYGTDYPTADGTAVRDYIHVSDLASAHVHALRYLLDGGPTTALNLGVGHGYSVRDVIETVERITGARVPTVERPRRAGDPPALVADAAKARATLGWRPEHSQLDEIVATAWRWLRYRHDLDPLGDHVSTTQPTIVPAHRSAA